MKPSEKSGHGTRIEAGCKGALEAGAIRLFLVLPREIDLILDREPLRRCDCRLRYVTARRRVRARGKDCCGQGAKRQQYRVALVVEAARDMVLSHVRDLVTTYR